MTERVGSVRDTPNNRWATTHHGQALESAACLTRTTGLTTVVVVPRCVGVAARGRARAAASGLEVDVDIAARAISLQFSSPRPAVVGPCPGAPARADRRSPLLSAMSRAWRWMSGLRWPSRTPAALTSSD
jgi:hypothetical protein